MPYRGETDESPAAARQLSGWCETFDGCSRITDLVPRSRVVTVGVIERIRVTPGDSLEAVIGDGTGTLKAIWTGRDELDGLALGRGLRLEGVLCGEAGVPVLRNPSWRLVSDPFDRSNELVDD